MSQDLMKARREALQKRAQQSYESRDDSGQFRNIFKEGIVLWKCGTGEHMLIVVPYMAGKFDPNSKEGEWTYVLIIWVHYGIGSTQDAFVCPARNYNQPCPICEYRENLRKADDFDEDLVKSLTPKKRSLYNVIVLDSDKDSQKGVQVFDVAHWYMERHLSSQAKIPAMATGGVQSYIPFADPELGKIVAFERKGLKMNSTFEGHKFLDRGYPIPEEYMAKAFVIDEWITTSTYEELSHAFYGGQNEALTAQSEDIPLEPKGNGGPRVAPPLLRTPPISEAPSTSPAPIPTSVAPPITPPITVPPTGLIPRVPLKPSATTTPTCPGGGVFGRDCEKLEKCKECPFWDACSEYTDKLIASQQQKAAASPTTQGPTPLRPPQPLAGTGAGGPIPIRPRPLVRK